MARKKFNSEEIEQIIESHGIEDYFIKGPGVRLAEAAQIFNERAEVYGDNYKNAFGQVMVALFPDGLTAKTAGDWNRLGLFIQIVAKMTRYANQYKAGGHVDSTADSSVYWNMLQEVDEIVQRTKAQETD